MLTLVVTMMVGYALFSEALTINGTATAKGNFSITTTCMPGYIDGFTYEDGETNKTIDNHYEKDSCIVQDNVITYSVDLLQPGANRIFMVKITNTGTIPATIINVSATGQNCNGNYQNGTFDSCQETSGSVIHNIEFMGFTDETKIYKFTPGQDVETSFPTLFENGKIVLQQGNSLYIGLVANWPLYSGPLGGAEHPSGTLIKENVKYIIDFEQVKVN